MSTPHDKNQSCARAVQKTNLRRIHRAAVLLLVAWSVGAGIFLGIIASRAPAEAVALEFDPNHSAAQRDQSIKAWKSDFPMEPFATVMDPYSAFVYPGQDAENRIAGLNNAAQTTVQGFWDSVSLLWFLYALALVVAAFAWRRPSVGCALGMLLIGAAGYPNLAENFIGLHNERLLPWILPIFLPGLTCLIVGVMDGMLHTDSKTAHDWQWFWGGVGLASVGTAFIGSLFLMEGNGRVSTKGAMALPFGLYLMWIHGWRLWKLRGSSIRAQPTVSEQLLNPTTEPTTSTGRPKPHPTAESTDALSSSPGPVAYSASFFWGVFVSLLLGGAGVSVWRGMSSELDGLRIIYVMLCPTIAAMLALVLSRRWTRLRRHTLWQIVPVSIFCLGLVAVTVLIPRILESVR